MRTSIDVTVEVEIERPLAAVWSYVADAERIPEWIHEITAAHVETDGPPGPGTVVRYTLEGARSGTWEIVEWDPPHRLAWDGPPLAMPVGAGRPRGSHTFAEVGEDRTLLVTRYQPEFLGAAVLLRPYLKRWLRRQRQRDAQKLKAALERDGDE